MMHFVNLFDPVPGPIFQVMTKCHIEKCFSAKSTFPMLVLNLVVKVTERDRGIFRFDSRAGPICDPSDVCCDHIAFVLV